MVRRRWDWPEKNELVMCTVKEVFDQGAYVELDEYDNKEGMVHISEIASGWIKNIRRHVKEGQKIVCKVLDVDKDKEHIDLSIRRVKDSQRSWKSEQWKRERKAEQLLTQAAQRAGEDIDTAYEKIGFPLQEKYDDIYTAFEEAARRGRKILKKDLDVEGDWIDSLMELIETSVEAPTVEVKGFVDLRTPSPNGVQVIGSALQEAESLGVDEDTQVEIQYVGAPTYSIEVVSPNYKKAEDVLRTVAQEAIEMVEEDGGTGEFYTEKGEQ
ncbi:MAG: translation initiation factor IF-2 subunit alpha [Candidatus Hadarchaeia archaeon]